MDSAKTFAEFKEILKSYEIKTFSKFNVYKSPKGFLDEKREISADMQLHWKDELPYFHFGSRIYTCHQGKDKNLGKKQKYVENRPEEAKTNLVQTTKKLDCPASIIVTRVYTLPQFKLENPTQSKKKAISVKIRSKLRNNEEVEGAEAFWFTLPSVDAHKNHIQGEISVITEPVDPEVRSKIKELVREGNRNALVISELIEMFVTTDLKQNDRRRRRFFPDIRTIRDIIKHEVRSVKASGQESILVSSEGGESCTVKFNRESNTSACTCTVQRKKSLCKHCLTVDTKKPLFCSDTDSFDSNDDQADPDPIMDLDHGCDDKDLTSEVNDEITQGALVYGEMKNGGSKRRKLIKECKSNMRDLSSLLNMLPDTALLDLQKTLSGLVESMQKRVLCDESTGLSLGMNETSKASKNTIKKAYGKLKTCAERGLTEIVGIHANAVRKANKRIMIESNTENGFDNSSICANDPLNPQQKMKKKK